MWRAIETTQRMEKLWICVAFVVGENWSFWWRGVYANKFKLILVQRRTLDPWNHCIGFTNNRLITNLIEIGGFIVFSSCAMTFIDNSNGLDGYNEPLGTIISQLLMLPTVETPGSVTDERHWINRIIDPPYTLHPRDENKYQSEAKRELSWFSSSAKLFSHFLLHTSHQKLRKKEEHCYDEAFQMKIN